MAFWNSGNDNKEELASSLRNLENGGLPLLAHRRIDAENRAEKHRFTSAMSVNEFLFTRENGYMPVSQVMGSSVYHIGWQYTPWYSSSEMTTITHAYWQGLTFALHRLQTEAHLLGAHGVVGVRIDRNQYDWADGMLEFSATGTAITVPGQKPQGLPFLSDLSGQEFWALHECGYIPVGIVFGNCTWYEVASWSTQMANNQSQGWGYNTGYANQELTDFTHGVYRARHLAMRRLSESAQVYNAEGVVGVKIETDVKPYEVDVNDQKRTDLIVRFEAIGTAIAHFEHGLVPAIDYSVMLD